MRLTIILPQLYVLSCESHFNLTLFQKYMIFFLFLIIRSCAPFLTLIQFRVRVALYKT